MGIYYVGAASCILERFPRLIHGASRIYGASAGALTAAVLTAGVSLGKLPSCPLELSKLAIKLFFVTVVTAACASPCRTVLRRPVADGPPGSPPPPGAAASVLRPAAAGPRLVDQPSAGRCTPSRVRQTGCVPDQGLHRQKRPGVRVPQQRGAGRGTESTSRWILICCVHGVLSSSRLTVILGVWGGLA